MANPITLGIETDDPKNYQSKLNNREKKVVEAAREDKNIEDTFGSAVTISAVNQSGGLLLTSTLAAGDEFALSTGKAQYTAHVQSVNGTVVNTFPVATAAGLELKVTGSATNGVLGWELVPNSIFSNSDSAYTIGSLAEGLGKKIFVEAQLTATDISDVNEWAVGFRKVEAFQADMDAYDELASLRIDASGDVQISTILNNGATSDTDTTINAADATSITLRVEADNNGKCIFKINGTETSVANFSFDAAEVVMPFIYLITDTDDPVAVVESFKCGYM